MTPEQLARQHIDEQLAAAGWHVCDASAANIHAAQEQNATIETDDIIIVEDIASAEGSFDRKCS